MHVIMMHLQLHAHVRVVYAYIPCTASGKDLSCN